MSYVAFVPALIALVGGLTLAGIIRFVANRDMPSNRTAELYSRRKSLLEKKRTASAADPKEWEDHKLNEIEQAMQEFDPLEDPIHEIVDDEISHAEKQRRFDFWIVKRKKKATERIRNLKLILDPDNPLLVHYVLSREGEPEVNLGPLPVIKTFDVPFGDIDTTAEGFFRPSKSAHGAGRSALTGEFVPDQKSHKSPRRRVARGKPA